MNVQRLTLTAILMSSAILGTLVAAPQPVHAKATTAAQIRTAQRATAQVSSPATQHALAAQLTAQGIRYDQMTPAQRQNAYVDVIVQLAAAPAAQNGRVNPATASTAQIAAATKQTVAAQAKVQHQVTAITHQGIDHTYGYVLNGFSTKAKVRDLATLRQLPGVANVTIAQPAHPNDANANSMADVATAWSTYKYKGAGTVVAVIDTGIDPTHKDLRLSDPSQAKLTRSKVAAFTKKAGYGKYFTAKVPYGHNYADNNELIKDTTPDQQHGMHVAGIIGANGTGTNPVKSVVGVAPEAQLLAMKVFSNSTSMPGAQTTSTISAIEDAAKLGADVLNLSLGNDSGEQNSHDPEATALAAAQHSGVAAVIAGGNAGASVSANRGDSTGVYHSPDAGTLGSPGTTRDVTTVASAENTKLIDRGMTATANGKTAFGPMQINFLTGTSHKVYNHRRYFVARATNGKLGIGNAKQYTKAAKGAVAVVQRSNQLSFRQQQLNAVQAGAVALIEINDDKVALTATNGSVLSGFPMAEVAAEDGTQIVNYVTKHPKQILDVHFGNAQMANWDAKKDVMSSFTSYGSVSDLAFKPDITAPGGNIWSTQNNNKYTNMSGTSMATPFISGTQALMTEAMNDPKGAFTKQYQALNHDQRIALIKTLEMNTATIVADKGHANVPVSPRRQGAGMVNVPAAIDAVAKNPSTVTAANGYPGIELRAFSGATKDFQVTLTNRTTRTLTYTLDTSDAKQAAVYTAATDKRTKALYDQAIMGAKVTANSAMTVAAGQSVTVPMSILLPTTFKHQQYVEGFLNFKGSDNSHLKIPYMGFYGDWGKPNIVDPLNGPTLNKNTGGGTLVMVGLPELPVALGVAGLQTSKQGRLVVNPHEIAFSTGKKSLYRMMKPVYQTYRNANNVKVQILNNHGKFLQQLQVQPFVAKTTFDDSTGALAKYTMAPSWDGKLYNAKTGHNTMVKDGTYIYRLIATVDGTHESQHYDIRVKVDSVAPKARKLQLHRTKHGYTLTAEAKDNFSGLMQHSIALPGATTQVNGVQNAENVRVVGKTHDGYSKLEFKLTKQQARTIQAGRNQVTLTVLDNAYNAKKMTATVQKPGAKQSGIVLNRGKLPAHITTNTTGYSHKHGSHYQITGTAPVKPVGSYTNAAGRQHSLKVTYNRHTHAFSTNVPLAKRDYHMRISLTARNTVTKRIRVALVPARITQLRVDGHTTYKAGAKQVLPVQTMHKSVTLSGRVSANTKKLTVTLPLTIQGTVVMTPTPVKVTKQTFKVTVPMTYGTNSISLKATDTNGNHKSLTQIISANANGKVGDSSNAVEFAHDIAFGLNAVNGKTKHYNRQTGILTVTGRVARPTTTLRLAGKAVHITRQGNFTLKLHVGTHGQAIYSLLVGDKASKQVVQDQLTFYVDVQKPTLKLDAAKTAKGVYRPIHTTATSYHLTGTIHDDFDFYRLAINHNQVAMTNPDIDMTSKAELNQKLDQNVHLKRGTNHVLVTVHDLGGNVAQAKLTIVSQAN